MQSNTGRKLAQIPANFLIVGIDPHKHKHASVMMTDRAEIRTKFKLNNNAQGFAELVRRVQKECDSVGAEGAIFAIEAGSHYWRNLAYYLQERDWRLRLISPFTLRRQREGEDLDRRKNDYRDATMAAELLRVGKYTETVLLQGNYAELRAAHQCYQRLCKEHTRTVNLLRGLLDGLFPEFGEVFRDPCGMTAMAVLLSVPIPAQIAAQKREEFVAAVRKAYRGRRLARKKLKALHELSATSVGVKPGAQEVAQELQLLMHRQALLAGQIQQVERRLRELVYRFEESRYLLSVPGLGELTVAGLMAEIGPLGSYGNSKDLVKLAGINPTQNESAGKGQRHTPMSKKGRSQLRSCLWQGVLSLLRSNPEFRAWAKQMEKRPASEHPLHKREVLGAGMNKLLRLYYALVSKEEMYRGEGVEEVRVAA
jgi:transposase